MQYRIDFYFEFIDFLGISDLYKWLIKIEKIYTMKGVMAQTTLLNIINNNHLPFPIPKLSQIQSYIYEQRLRVLCETYPDISKSIKDICKTKYNQELAEDEVFYIESHVSQHEISILFTTKSSDKYFEAKL